MPVFHTPAIETNTPSIASALHSLVQRVLSRCLTRISRFWLILERRV